MAAIGTTNNTGWTTTSSVSEALPVIIESARIVRLFVNVVTKLVDRHTLPQGSGLVWNEIALNNLTASNITETTILENPQQLSDNLFQIVPLQVGISTLITDRTRRRISANVAGLIGQLAGRAMERKKDIDGLTIIANATTALGGSTLTMQSGYVAAGVARIQGNSTEPLLQGPYYTVLHPFQVKAIQDEVVAGIGTYNVPQGLTEETFRQGYSGNLFGTEVYTDGNITIDSTTSAKGGVFGKLAIVLVQGYEPRAETQRRPDIGGGSDVMYMYDEYAYGERSAGNWLYSIYTDVTSPSS